MKRKQSTAEWTCHHLNLIYLTESEWRLYSYIVHIYSKLRKHKFLNFYMTHIFLSFILSRLFLFFQYFVQYCFICRPSENAGIEPRIVATSTLAVRHSNHSSLLINIQNPGFKNRKTFCNVNVNVRTNCH